MKRKSYLGVVIAAIMVILFVGCSVTFACLPAYAEVDEVAEAEESGVDFVEVLKEKLIPAASSVILSCVGLYALIAPLIKSSAGTVNKMVLFAKSFGDYKKETEMQFTSIISMFQEAVSKLCAEVEELKNIEKKIPEIKEAVEKVEIEYDTLKKIVTMAFVNNAELVRKGVAAKICKITSEDDAAKLPKGEDRA